MWSSRTASRARKSGRPPANADRLVGGSGTLVVSAETDGLRALARQWPVLEEYVRKGGTLVVNVEAGRALPEKLLGLKPTGKQTVAEEWTPDGGQPLTATPYEVADVELAGAKVLAWAGAKVPLITGSSSDQLNKGRTYTFTPFARASQFARAQLQMSKLVSDTPKVAVIFENTAFGTSTSNGLKELAPGEGVEIVMFEPYSAGFTDASPLINKVKSSGANALFSVSYLNDLILIVRTVKQVGLNIAINGGSGGFVIPDFYKNVGKLAEGLQGVAHWNHDMDPNAEKVNTEYKKRTGEFLFEYAGGLVAQTFMIADALERAASTDPQKVREALSALDVSSGYAAMAPGGKVKFGPDGKNVYGRPVGVQWQNGDLASVFPKEDARAPLLKT